MALIVIILLLLTTIGIIKRDAVESYIQTLLNLFEDLGLWASPLLASAIACMTVLMLPTFPMTLGAAAIFVKLLGKWPGSAVAIGTAFTGLWIGSVAGFILGRTFFKEFAEEELHTFAWMQVINQMINENGWWVVFLVRMSPLLPTEAFNYIASLTTLNLPSYIIGCWGTLMPVSLMVVSSVSAYEAATDNASDQKSMIVNILIVCFNLLFMVLISIILFRVYKQYAAKHPELTNGTQSNQYMLVGVGDGVDNADDT